MILKQCIYREINEEKKRYKFTYLTLYLYCV